MLEEMAKPLDRARFGPRNRLLAALLPEDLVSFRTHLERVPLVDGRILFEANEPITRVYFVEAGVVALVAVFENGTSAVSAIVGRGPGRRRRPIGQRCRPWPSPGAGDRLGPDHGSLPVPGCPTSEPHAPYDLSSLRQSVPRPGSPDHRVPRRPHAGAEVRALVADDP
jgi:hypothetical protein